MPGHHVLDVQNRGTLEFLPETCVIETSCFVERDAIRRNPVTGKASPALISLLSAVKAYEILAVQAALSGERSVAMQALACNPITADLDLSAPCLDEMLEQNRSLLPRFFQ